MIKDAMQNISILQVFVLGCFFIIALYHTNIYLLRRDDSSSLYLVIGCVISITRTVAASLYEVISGYPEFVFIFIRRIDYMSYLYFITKGCQYF